MGNKLTGGYLLVALGEKHQVGYRSVILVYSWWSSDDFLRDGLTMTRFMSGVNVYFCNEQFTTFMINGRSRSRQFLRTDAGIGSSMKDFKVDLGTRSDCSSYDTDLK